MLGSILLNAGLLLKSNRSGLSFTSCWPSTAQPEGTSMLNPKPLTWLAATAGKLALSRMSDMNDDLFMRLPRLCDLEFYVDRNRSMSLRCVEVRDGTFEHLCRQHHRFIQSRV